jgi:holo-[acyl-carrier protein] synthase
MIVGLGTDIVSVDRIAKLLEKNKGAFVEKLCTKEEKIYLQSCADITPKLAKLWAVKEATVKALGTGFIEGISFKDIELRHNNLGKPQLAITGKAKEKLDEITKGDFNVVVSLSDDKPWAQAVVVIEKK